MSRTIRRRNCPHLTWSQVDSYFEKGIYSQWKDWWFNRMYPGCSEKQIKGRLNAELHSDSSGSRWNAPSWFRREMEQSFRAKNKQKIILYLKQQNEISENEEDLMEIPFKRNINWNWF